eukprot:m.751157 g.751157  ORF g.751157 m.751157 type:complete len:711 (-) comp23165_c0_seq2:3337-5469(-)
MSRTKSTSFREEEDDHDRMHQSRSPDVILAGDGSLSDIDSEAATTQDFTFEVAWEVVNKVGGIYTVIKTKTETTVKELGEQYCLLGPYKSDTAKMQLEEHDLPDASAYPALAATIQSMRDRGIVIHFGRWLVPGAPKVVLFDMDSTAPHINNWKHDLFEKTRIGCPDSDGDAQNAIVFGYLCAWFLGEYMHACNGQQKVVAHFHEWLAGIGLVLCRMRKIKVATIFTTHATLLGRYLCADSKIDFYNQMSHFDPDKEAGDRGIYHRYCIERASAYAAHTFTTVSQITADEAAHLLKRKADIITPNGLNSYKFAALHEFQTMHAASKSKIEKFIIGHFHGHLDFDLDKTLYFFLAGRYEYRNKGADLYLESLARLNHSLQAEGSDTTVVAFIIMPAPTNSYNVETLRGQAAAKRHQDTVSDIKSKIGQRLLNAISRGQMPKPEDLLQQSDKVKLKRCVFSTSQVKGLPPVVTHNVIEDPEKPDEVLSNLRRIHLFNAAHDRVKVVFHPEFLNSSSPLLPLEYEEFVRGCHLGVFPSYYEPWGYTPAECTVMGVPSITSNLSGFGCFIEQEIANPASYGIMVVDRRFKSPEESVAQLTEYMVKYCGLSRRQRINLRNRTERLSELLGWDSLGVYYTVARHMAVEEKYGGANNGGRSSRHAQDQQEQHQAEAQARRSSVRNRFDPLNQSLSEASLPPAQWTMDDDREATQSNA